MKALDLQTPTAATYRRNALQLLTGKKAKPVYRKLKSMATMKSLTATLKGIGVGGSSETKEDEQMIRETMPPPGPDTVILVTAGDPGGGLLM